MGYIDKLKEIAEKTKDTVGEAVEKTRDVVGEAVDKAKETANDSASEVRGNSSGGKKLHTLKCSNCGANVSLTDNPDVFYCSYCGAKNILTNENEQVIRYVDEAKIKKIDAKREQQQINQEIKAENKRSAKKVLKIILIVYLSMIGAGLLIGAIAFFANQIPRWSAQNRGEINPPISSTDVVGKNCNDVNTMFTEAGFTNVKLEDLGDTEKGEINTVKEVAINGNVEYSKGDFYTKDSSVVIRYYSKAKTDTSNSIYRNNTNDTSAVNNNRIKDYSLNTETSTTSSASSSVSSSEMSRTDAIANFKVYAENQGFKVSYADAVAEESGDDWMVKVNATKGGTKYSVTGTVTGNNDDYQVMYFNYMQI